MALSVALLGVAFIYGMCLSATLIATGIIGASKQRVRMNLGPANVVLVLLMISSIVAAALGH